MNVFHHPAPPEAPHHRFWPAGVPRALDVPDESLWQALERRAEAEPQAVGLDFLGRRWTWQALHDEAERLAGALLALGVGAGDRVIVFMQNCPQFLLGYHAVLRANAVVVPVNPMNKADELDHYIQDSGARVALASSDIAGELARAQEMLQGEGGARLEHLVVFDLAEALPDDIEAAQAGWPLHWRRWLPTRHPKPTLAGGSVHAWTDLVARGLRPGPLSTQGQDLAVLPYTSGTTGAAKGCMHNHASLMHNAMTSQDWLDLRPGDVMLIVVPMFHITGMVMAMLAAIRLGASIVLLPRWDRDVAAAAIEQQRVTHWPNIPTMVIDLLGKPDLQPAMLRSLRYIGGGGAAMPEAIATRLKNELGLDYIEGYGLTETSGPTHSNPPGAVRRQCLGIPYLSTRARVVDPDTLHDVATGEVGEILVHGPQVFQGYWRNPDATRAAFVELDGLRWFRTGDLGRVDADGYHTMADRLKRMINASGFKVWPAEVEALLYRHPGVQEVCIIATRDDYRGESVKAVIVPKPEARETLTEADVIAWSREHMAVYKVPRQVEFVEQLPKSASGKLLWRLLQVEQDQRDARTESTPPA
ncbi:MAG: AMP-binding protein [Burkholderiales bacterium]|jgi:fatty-acyl-CoA synthase|nr:AMP-binding protein [Burkholderiales bacterium]